MSHSNTAVGSGALPNQETINLALHGQRNWKIGVEIFLAAAAVTGLFFSIISLNGGSVSLSSSYAMTQISLGVASLAIVSVLRWNQKGKASEKEKVLNSVIGFLAFAAIAVGIAGLKGLNLKFNPTASYAAATGSSLTLVLLIIRQMKQQKLEDAANREWRAYRRASSLPAAPPVVAADTRAALPLTIAPQPGIRAEPAPVGLAPAPAGSPSPHQQPQDRDVRFGSLPGPVSIAPPQAGSASLPQASSAVDGPFGSQIAPRSQFGQASLPFGLPLNSSFGVRPSADHSGSSGVLFSIPVPQPTAAPTIAAATAAPTHGASGEGSGQDNTAAVGVGARDKMGPSGEQLFVDGVKPIVEVTTGGPADSALEAF